MVKSEYLQCVKAVTGGAAPFGPALIENFKAKCAPNDVKFREGNFEITPTSPARLVTASAIIPFF